MSCPSSKVSEFRSAFLSIICSFVGAALVYFILIPSVREAQLKLGSILADGTYDITTGKRELTERWFIHVENNGKLPVGSVVIGLKGRLLRNAGSPEVEIDPPLPHKIDRTQDKDIILVVLDSPMPPTSQFNVTLTLRHAVGHNKHSTPPPLGLTASRWVSAWVSSDGTATISVPWRDQQGYTWRVLGTPGSRKGTGPYSFTLQVLDYPEIPAVA